MQAPWNPEQIASIYETVRRAIRRGQWPSMPGNIGPAGSRVLHDLFQTLKEKIRAHSISIDDRQKKCYDTVYMIQNGLRMDRVYVSYARVSTKEQGRSGLGLEAQKQAVIDFVQKNGGELLKEYVEIESGRNPARPELAKAIAHAKRAQGVLLVAKLDRLARNVHFLSGLMESGVDFLAVDNPIANRLTIHILSAVAEEEARAISSRTREALASAKARGVKLGSHRKGHWTPERDERRRAGLAKGRIRAAAVRSALADEAYRDLLPEIQILADAGVSLKHIADRLNSDGHRTRHGKAFCPMAIKRILDRSRRSAGGLRPL